MFPSQAEAIHSARKPGANHTLQLRKHERVLLIDNTRLFRTVQVLHGRLSIVGSVVRSDRLV